MQIGENLVVRIEELRDHVAVASFMRGSQNFAGNNKIFADRDVALRFFGEALQSVKLQLFGGKAGEVGDIEIEAGVFGNRRVT